MFISADLTEPTYATTSIADTTTSEATIDLTGDSYVTISASDVVISLTPDSSSSSSTAYAKTTVTLESDSSSSIQLYLSMSGNTTSLYKDGDTSSSSPTIDTTTTPGSLDDFEDNTWGYSLDNTTYRSVPAAGSANSDNLVIELDNNSSNSGESSTITQDIYYGIKVSSSLASGTYSNSVTYTATVNSSPITATAERTKIEVDGEESDNMVVDLENTITVTTNIKTDIHGEPRVYYIINDGENSPTYQECSTVKTSENEDGYLTITCTVTPTTTAAEGEATLYITAKGSEDDCYCAEGIYSSDSSDCEAGNWKWGTFEIELPEIKEGSSNAFGITYMQEMTTDICDAAEVDTTAQLIDIRDNKTYWVAKLKDGNCWMTQNLDFDLTSSTVLYSASSDVDVDTTLSNASLYTILSNGCFSGTCNGYVYNVIQTWDPGEYVITNPTDSTSCGAISYLSTCADGSGYDRFASVSDDTSYDAHYLVGNYYSWLAATAGSGATGTSSGGVATNSICPKNWQLPYSGDSSSSLINGSFYYLLNDLTSSVSDITSAPYYFVRGGYVYTGGLIYAGNYGSYWSRVASSSNFANHLYFRGSSYVYPSDGSTRWYGYSVRCVAV